MNIIPEKVVPTPSIPFSLLYSRICGGAVRSLDDVYRHVAHFFDLGARRNLALGSDFDGAALPPCLDSAEKTADFYEYLLSRDVSQADADGIFFENARTFLRKNLG